MTDDRHSREATIVSYNPRTGTIKFIVPSAEPFDKEHEAPVPVAWAGTSGEFSGGYPNPGSTIWVSQGPGGRWMVNGYSLAQGVTKDSSRLTTTEPRRNLITWFAPGRYVTQVRSTDGRGFAGTMYDPEDGVFVGNNRQYINADPHHSIVSTKFQQTWEFNDSHRLISGPIYRDVEGLLDVETVGQPLEEHEPLLRLIGLDPRSTGLGVRNLPLTETREIIYEFSPGTLFENDDIESGIQSGENQVKSSGRKRQDVRTDTLSLNLSAQNFLIERTVGTVVDIFGNILNLNRDILPSGQLDTLSLRRADNRETAYANLQEQQRKSIAYHFELNARKPSTPKVSDTSDYARNRSRLFLDIDKEGQFKLNVPMSSEVGNVGLLTRYENYSVLKADEESREDFNDFVRNVDNKDVFAEEFGRGSVDLSSNSEEFQAFASPTDRTTNTKIKLGTGFHNIADSIITHQRAQPIAQAYPDSRLNQLTPITNVVNPEVIVSGEGANAGGRSGTISLDGMLSMSVGANTVDRQSMWLDCAGGIVANIGRDLQGISYAGTYDGDVMIQIGGATISSDSRFDNATNDVRDGALDIRVVRNAMLTIVRIDDNGVSVYSPATVDIVSESNIRIKSFADLILDGKAVYVYTDENGRGMRWIERAPNGNSAKTIK